MNKNTKSRFMQMLAHKGKSNKASGKHPIDPDDEVASKMGDKDSKDSKKKKSIFSKKK